MPVASPDVRRDSSARSGDQLLGEAKVRSDLWVSIEDVAARAGTSGTVSEKTVSIHSVAVAVVTALVAAACGAPDHSALVIEHQDRRDAAHAVSV